MITKRQRVFIEEYLTCWNASEAARRAGYSHPTKLGSRMLAMNEIAAEIGERMRQKAMTADEAIARLAQHARGSMDDFLDEDGRIDLGKARDRGVMHLIKAYTENRKIGKKIELYDAQAALGLIGKHLGILSDRMDLSGSQITLKVVYDDDRKPD